MKNKLISVLCTIIGMLSFVYCVMNNIDGVTRFILLFVGVIGVTAGSVFSFLKPKQKQQ